ncbi:uncharacterized protein METZ01_LOCUS505053 [marine metagenome]|uniref:Glucosamine/galactosamine-6-phosphate isomerase domain-containing protein n=1 Tax=marine metagenome TaxID=408172 RepID=A0A383E6H7_9ZZZZ
MQVINVKDNNEAAKKALKITLKACEKLNRKFDLALTGGRFGEAFVKHLATSNFPFGKCRIFQTDERYVPIADDESIQGMLNKELIKVDESIQGCCYFFGIL